jgi:RNA polymerase primary sigma factor
MSREDEVDAGKRIEAGESLAIAAMVASPLGRREIPGLVDRLRGEPASVVTETATAVGLASAEVVAGELPEAALGERRRHLLVSDAELARVVRRLSVALRRLRAAGHDDGELGSYLERDTGMSPSELRRLRQTIEEGEAQAALAKAELVQAHLRHVVWIARRYADRSMPLLDLIQEGNIGLMTAANKFDYRLGHRFATYANWWIRQAITRALSEQGRTVRLPAHRAEALGRLSRARRQLSHRLGREPSIDEVAADLRVERQLIEHLLQWAPDALSLEMPLGDGNAGTLGELVPNPAAEPPLVAVMSVELTARAREQLATLTPREQEVLTWRFGLEDDREHTLEEIGERLGLTRERIRQIETRALGKLRHPSRASALRSFIGAD